MEWLAAYTALRDLLNGGGALGGVRAGENLRGGSGDDADEGGNDGNGELHFGGLKVEVSSEEM